MSDSETNILMGGEPVLLPMVLQDISVNKPLEEVVSVRSAKAHLSGLLDRVAEGHEITITSGGKPKARLVPVETKKARKTFAFSPGYVPAPWRGGPTSEEIIREDRDSRGW